MPTQNMAASGALPAAVSVVILTYNEEANIGQALRSVAGWANEIHVVDSFSTDRTVEIAPRDQLPSDRALLPGHRRPCGHPGERCSRPLH